MLAQLATCGASHGSQDQGVGGLAGERPPTGAVLVKCTEAGCQRLGDVRWQWVEMG